MACCVMNTAFAGDSSAAAVVATATRISVAMPNRLTMSALIVLQPHHAVTTSFRHGYGRARTIVAMNRRLGGCASERPSGEDRAAALGKSRCRPWRLAALVVVLAGCALYSDVTIVPLTIQPGNIDHPNDLPSMVRKADLVRAVQLAPSIEAKHGRSAQELAALGNAEMLAGRYDEARRHLRAAIDLAPFRTTFSSIAWDLSQLEYMSNNYETSLDWARMAGEHGMVIKKWHMDYLAALSGVNVYQVSG